MSFTQFLNEMEEERVRELELSKKEKVADFIRTIEGLTDEKFRDFAVNELGMDDTEADTIVYKMLRDFLLAGDKDEDGIPDELQGDEEGGLGDEIADVDEKLPSDELGDEGELGDEMGDDEY